MSVTKNQLIDYDPYKVFVCDEESLDEMMVTLEITRSTDWSKARKAHETFNNIVHLQFQQRGLAENIQRIRPSSQLGNIVQMMELEQKLQGNFMALMTNQMNNMEQAIKSCTEAHGGTTSEVTYIL